MIMNATGKSGKLVMKVCITPNGDVSLVEMIDSETTIRDTQTLKNAVNAMWNYKYEKDEQAPEEECGKFTVTVDNWKGRR